MARVVIHGCPLVHQLARPLTIDNPNGNVGSTKCDQRIRMGDVAERLQYRAECWYTENPVTCLECLRW